MNLFFRKKSKTWHTKILFLLFIPTVSLSQETKFRSSTDSLKVKRTSFIGLTGGIRYSAFQDLATSPHIYNGTSIYAEVIRLKTSYKNEFEMGISVAIGGNEMDYNDHTSSNSMYNFTIFYSHLYQVKSIKSKDWNVKVGAMFNTTGNIRSNESFGNNSLGFEVFPTLFGSLKVSKDLSRLSEKNIKFLFIEYKLKPITKGISLRINPGLINSSLRNEFIYFTHSRALNKRFLDDYAYKIFSGFRINTAVDYTIQLPNKNSYQFSYLWEGYKTGGSLDKFHMAIQTIKLTLLFNTTNK